MTYNALIGEIKKLPRHKRLEIVEKICDSLVEEDIEPLTAAQKAELRRRMKEHEKDPSSAIPLEQVLSEMSRKKR